ncbi:MAG: DUF4870 domain-containing protein [Acidobacteriota bacterium]|nr:DUF4870 domain-containing protein [Acidobacteriota bacterium]
MTIPAEERGMATMTHLSGLAGYLVPGLGVIAPIIIWVLKKDSPAISKIAKQALFLNIAVFLIGILGFLLLLTVILIPLSFLLWFAAGLVAVILPIIGAVKAGDGTLYEYPLIGSWV